MPADTPPPSLKPAYPWNCESHLLDYLDAAEQRFGHKPAFSQERHTLTFSDIDRLSKYFAAFLQSRVELHPGDRIAVQLPNILAYPIVIWGIIRAGMVVVNVNPQYTAFETHKQLKDAEVKGWVCSENAAHLIDPINQHLSIPLIVTSKLFALHPPVIRYCMESYLRYRHNMKPSLPERQTFTLNSVLKVGKKLRYQRPNLQPHDLALLQYTGGSTGGLKGAMLSHQNIIANMEQVAGFLHQDYTPGAEILIAPLPIYHIFAFNTHCATPLITGAHNILVLDPTKLGHMIKSMRRWQFTAITGVNTLFHSLVRSHKFKSLDFGSLRYGIAGGMKLDPEVGRQFEAITGKPILEGFGMSELSPVASLNPPHANRWGSIGRPLPFTDLGLIDREGQPITTIDTLGELIVRGPQVMLGYWRQEAETQLHMVGDGWIKTGDLARFDQDDYWFIEGRSKRMILVSGFNVYPQDIDEVLRLHPDISDCRTVGVPHPVCGETIKVYVVRKSPELTAAAIREHCRHYLTAYKLPRHIEFCSEIPANSYQ